MRDEEMGGGDGMRHKYISCDKGVLMSVSARVCMYFFRDMPDAGHGDGEELNGA